MDKFPLPRDQNVELTSALVLAWEVTELAGTFCARYPHMSVLKEHPVYLSRAATPGMMTQGPALTLTVSMATSPLPVSPTVASNITRDSLAAADLKFLNIFSSGNYFYRIIFKNQLAWKARKKKILNFLPIVTRALCHMSRGEDAGLLISHIGEILLLFDCWSRTDKEPIPAPNMLT